MYVVNTRLLLRPKVFSIVILLFYVKLVDDAALFEPSFQSLLKTTSIPSTQF